MKRSLSSDAEEFCHHLQGIRSCLLRVKEDIYHMVMAAEQASLQRLDQGQDDDNNNKENINPLTNLQTSLQHSTSHLLRCCLHLYNTLEEGLNYLEDPGATMAEVHATMLSAENLVETLTSPSSALPESLQHTILISVQVLLFMHSICKYWALFLTIEYCVISGASEHAEENVGSHPAGDGAAYRLDHDAENQGQQPWLHSVGGEREGQASVICVIHGYNCSQAYIGCLFGKVNADSMSVLVIASRVTRSYRVPLMLTIAVMLGSLMVAIPLAMAHVDWGIMYEQQKPREMNDVSRGVSLMRSKIQMLRLRNLKDWRPQAAHLWEGGGQKGKENGSRGNNITALLKK